ncbi:MAG: hypothetical protein QXV69_04760 [Sulfolobaceae archaeon]
MFAYIGESREKLIELYEKLKSSANCDTRRNCIQHGDGWGYVIFDKIGNRIHFYKSGSAIYEESVILPSFKKAYSIFHARKSSSQLKGAIYSHPFFTQNATSFMFLAHNGEIDHAKVIREFNLNRDPKLTVDSEIILEVVKDLGVRKGLETLKEYTKSALDVFILEIERMESKVRLYALSYYTKKETKGVYHLYINKEDSAISIFSSTLIDYGANGEEVEFGKVYEFE